MKGCTWITCSGTRASTGLVIHEDVLNQTPRDTERQLDCVYLFALKYSLCRGNTESTAIDTKTNTNLPTKFQEILAVVL
jgi:hypothetical protein